MTHSTIGGALGFGPRGCGFEPYCVNQINADVAQSEERVPVKDEVVGS